MTKKKNYGDDDFAVFPETVLSDAEEKRIIHHYQQTGKTHQISKLFNRSLAKRLWKRFYFFQHDHDEAMDGVQETFLRVTRKLHEFRFQAKFSTWVYSFAVRVLSEWFRRRKKLRGPSPEDSEGKHDPAPSQGNEGQDDPNEEENQSTSEEGEDQDSTHADDDKGRRYPESEKWRQYPQYDDGDWAPRAYGDLKDLTAFSPEDELSHQQIVILLEECRFSIVSTDGTTEDPKLSRIYDMWVENLVLETEVTVRDIEEACDCTASQVASIQRKLEKAITDRVGQVFVKKTKLERILSKYRPSVVCPNGKIPDPMLSCIYDELASYIGKKKKVVVKKVMDKCCCTESEIRFVWEQIKSCVQQETGKEFDQEIDLPVRITD